MNFRSIFYTLSILTLINTNLVKAEDLNTKENDKWQYNLFNPVPKDKMRDLSTDRPDKTESPYTVDAGHFQYEGDIVSYIHNQSDKDTEQEFLFNNMNLKLGITNNIDFQLVIPTYNLNLINSKIDASGFGDITTRLKYNIFGNDSGSVSIGAMPYLKIPTANDKLGNKAFEGGITFPASVELPNDFSLGFMYQFDYKKNEKDNNYHAEYVTTVTLGRGITENINFYTELFSQSSTEKDSEWVATFDFGFTYLPTPDIQIDIGMNTGLTPASDRFNPFLGLSFRI